MKTKRLVALLAAAALALLSSCMTSCTSPFTGNDPFRQAQGFGMQGQMAAHQQASAMAAAAGPRRLAPMRTIPLVPTANTYAQ